MHNVIGAHIQMDPHLPSKEVLEAHWLKIHPDLLFHPEIVIGPNNKYRIIKDYIAFHGVPYLIQSTVKGVSIDLITMVYTEKEDREKAFMLLDALQNSLRTPLLSPVLKRYLHYTLMWTKRAGNSIRYIKPF